MIIIGITGSIGMGKTTVANMLRDMGIPVHCSDSDVHVLLSAGGDAVSTVAQMFPETLKYDENGKAYIDKDELGKIVFFNRERKKHLEDYLHPLVEERIKDFADHMKAKKHRIIALDIPLLFETGKDKDVDITICVSASAEKQKERVLARRNMIEAKFDAIVAGQMRDADKCARADYVVDSNVSMEKMKEQVASIIKKIDAGYFSSVNSGDAESLGTC